MRPRDIGQLSERVTLETQEPVAFEEAGGREAAPIVQVTLWAHVAYDNFSATEDDARLSTRETIEVTMRWRSDVSRDTTVFWRGNRYTLLSLEQPDTRCEWLILRCQRSA